MDVVEQIKEHERLAEAGVTARNAHRWQAAKLIWETIKAGFTYTELGAKIDRSRTHVLYMFRCWDVTGKHYADDNNFEDFPNLNETYNSDAVRHPNGPQEEQAQGSSGSSRRGTRGQAQTQQEPERDPRETASDWLAQAVEAVGLLVEHTITWQFLTSSDLEALSKLAYDIEALDQAVKAANVDNGSPAAD